MWRAAILTLSDKGTRGEREDTSGPAIRRMMEKVPAWVLVYDILPDERERIEKRLISLADGGEIDLILTTGGTGVGPRDVTPEATLRVIDREIPGMAEAMRSEGCKKTPRAMISRGIVGIRRETLIINLPGSPKGARESLEVLLPVLSHVLEKLKGDPSECAQ
ncbi:MAG: MogA/MoaB family molybdenum cofactor biosynthesis protein [Nitrospirae bacterium]|nr:MogA/MoaB family molybdenum cofactor biosynthesis protein [Nitrospirota bacterium]